MRAEDLTRGQAAAVKNKLRPMLGYLGRLKKRMVQRGFLSDDPLLAAVVRAEDAVHALHVQLHYLSCGDVVGQPPRCEGEIRAPHDRRQLRRDSH